MTYGEFRIYLYLLGFNQSSIGYTDVIVWKKKNIYIKISKFDNEIIIITGIKSILNTSSASRAKEFLDGL